jgi:hypothetical protein
LKPAKTFPFGAFVICTHESPIESPFLKYSGQDKYPSASLPKSKVNLYPSSQMAYNVVSFVKKSP